MQALAYIHGGHIIRAPEPIHGRLSQIQHSGNPIFADIPSGSQTPYALATSSIAIPGIDWIILSLRHYCCSDKSRVSTQDVVLKLGYGLNCNTLFSMTRSNEPMLGFSRPNFQFAGCNSGFEVVRYHSLAVSPESLPACLEPIAWTCGRHQAVNLESPQAEASLFVFCYAMPYCSWLWLLLWPYPRFWVGGCIGACR